MQRHILNTAAPFTVLHDLLENKQAVSHEEILAMIEKSLCLLGNASNSVSTLRRSKVLYAINPSKISLAEALYPNAGTLLFGNDINKLAADSADISRNLQKNLASRQLSTQNYLSGASNFHKYQSKNEKFRQSTQGTTRYTRGVNRGSFAANKATDNSPFGTTTTPPVNGTSSLFLQQLEKYNIRSKYFTHRFMLQNCFSISSISVNSSSFDNSKSLSNREGSKLFDTERCNSSSTVQQRRLLPSNVFSRKERRRLSSSYRNNSFQNGKSHHSKISHKPWRLHDKHRLDRRLSVCPNSSGISKIPSIYLAKQVLPIQSDAVRAKCSSQSIHKVIKTGRSLASRPGNPSDYILGRYPNNGFLCGNGKTTQTIHYSPSRIIGIPDKLRQVDVNSNSEDSIPRVVDRFDTNVIHSARNKNHFNSQSMSTHCQQSTSGPFHLIYTPPPVDEIFLGGWKL